MSIQPQRAHFFLSSPENLVQNETTVFGPIDPDHFRITSKFTFSGNQTAYSVCKGVVLVQPQSSTKVNIILRPYIQPIPGLNIKYFIYRGLKKSDFIEGTLIKGSGSDLVNKMNADYNAFYSGLTDNGEPVAKPPFSPSFIGYNDTDEPEKLLSDFFFKESILENENDTTIENDAFELPMIGMGQSLANFADGDCGIDVVLNYGDFRHEFDNGDFKFNLQYARSADAVITLTGNDLQKKLQREQITQFIDIAAFYGLFTGFENAAVFTTAGSTTSEKKGTMIYTDLLQNFFSKNRWYIYIQSDRTRSYNFYGNYFIEGSTINSLKAGIVDSSIEEIAFGKYGWPLIVNIHQIPQENSEDYLNRYHLQFTTDNNSNIMLYSQVGSVDNAQHNNFCNADDLRELPDLNGLAPEFTKIITLDTPAIFEDSVKKNIGSLSIILYQGKIYDFISAQSFDENQVSIYTYAIPNFFDDVFDLIKSSPLFSTSVQAISVMTSEKLNLINYYFDRRQQGICAVQTVTVSDEILTGLDTPPMVQRITYMTEAVDVMTNAASSTGSITSKILTSPTAGENGSSRKLFKLPDPYYYEIIFFTDSQSSIKGLQLKSMDASIPDKILLGITKSENDSLKLIIEENVLQNPRLFLVDLFEFGNELISPENVHYQKYKVGVVGETAGALQLYMPFEDVNVFSLGRNYHFSKGYSDHMQIPTTSIVGSSLITAE